MAITSPSPAPVASRSRAMSALFTGAALINAAMATASAVSTIVAAQWIGSGWGGLPPTAGIVGTGLGVLLVTRFMTLRGRRAGLALGYGAAAIGGILAAAAVPGRHVAALVTGMVLLGLGNAAAQLSRYTAADLYPKARRGFAIGLVVWAGAVGAVGGPLLLSASANAATAAGWIGYCGPFLLAALCGAAALLTTVGAPAHTAIPARSRVTMHLLLGTPAVRSAIAVMVTAQVVMVAVMTAVPLELHQHGHGLGGIGAVLSVHTLGMFALSPLTGWLLDHVDARAVMAAGLLGLAAASGLAVLTAKEIVTLQSAPLFLLGYAWNLCFVGGSSHLARKLPAKVAVSVEGAVDSVVWITAAGASLCSTIVLLGAGYSVLAGTVGVLVVVPTLALLAEVHAKPEPPAREEI